MKDFEEEFDDKNEKYFRNMSTIVPVKFFNSAYALLCDRNMLSTQGFGLAVCV